MPNTGFPTFVLNFNRGVLGVDGEKMLGEMAPRKPGDDPSAPPLARAAGGGRYNRRGPPVEPPAESRATLDGGGVEKSGGGTDTSTTDLKPGDTRFLTSKEETPSDLLIVAGGDWV